MWTEIGKNTLNFGHQLVLPGCFTDPQHVLMVQKGATKPLPRLVSDQEAADARIMLPAEDCSHLFQRLVLHSPTLGDFCFKSGQLCSGPCEAWVLTKTNLRW